MHTSDSIFAPFFCPTQLQQQKQDSQKNFVVSRVAQSILPMPVKSVWRPNRWVTRLWVHPRNFDEVRVVNNIKTSSTRFSIRCEFHQACGTDPILKIRFPSLGNNKWASASIIFCCVLGIMNNKKGLYPCEM